MPALSQSLTFIQNSTSTVLLYYPNSAIGPVTYISNRVKGDGYYGGSSGFHTIQLQTTNFVGRIEMQASLASEPSDPDWFTVALDSSDPQGVDTSGLVLDGNLSYVQYSIPTTIVKTYNFTGNFVWVRAKISEFTEGTVNSIKYNH